MNSSGDITMCVVPSGRDVCLAGCIDLVFEHDGRNFVLD